MRTKKRATKEPAQKTVVFLHPDLGIGGAERLVVDAAVGLQNRGYKVVIFTSHCDPKHCFDEARDGTLDVRVRGNTLVPPSILSRFNILCAIARQLHLILDIALFTSELRSLSPSAFFVDQLSAGLPLLQLLRPQTPILFYCHFPDLLLVQGRQKWWKRVYRVPFDAWEQWSMSFADTIAVNSLFTKGVVSRTWPSLAKAKDFKVLYPAIDTGGNDKEEENEKEGDGPMWKGKRVILSINRFERKKDVGLAIRAYAGLPEEKRKGVRLVIAGGYDNRVTENVSYHRDLVALADSLSLKSATTSTLITTLNIPAETEVLFLLSVPNTLKQSLLRSASLLVYTPSNEHFGIVPLEAMLAGVPVLAADSGGPRETVVEGETGWLRDPERVDEWTGVMEKALYGLTEGEKEEMSRAGRERVKGNFAVGPMAERLDELLEEAEREVQSRPRGVSRGVIALGVVGLVMVLLGAWIAARGLTMLRVWLAALDGK
ncbi:UDP-Glycosyltransferase/glycogen phosphorylase [Coniochaeta ligniaria NRRL 30616]|uniref:Alpha-1,3/1,6-mannosyltransferase ALG2 n=1 Tax=Coniochaeta ligniaria NRRL 30616 TaxID=1408157 RepID=A0A1J7IKA8_9PEZI|nr:UDP-Glycosyltransferase/glycogen phosphorylase [Coniochaeta ligniaria NRRL 30616]